MQYITRFVSIYFILAILSLSIMTIYLILSKTITSYVCLYVFASFFQKDLSKYFPKYSYNAVYEVCERQCMFKHKQYYNNYCLLSKNLIKVIILDLVWHGQVPGKIYKYNCDQYNSLLLVF